MRKIVTRLAIVAALAVLVMAPWGATLAQLPFPIPGLGGPPSEGSCPSIDMLRNALAVTDAQKGVWDAYVAALKANYKDLHGMRETMLPVPGKSAADAYDAHVTAMGNRLKALQDVKPTFTAFYSSLSGDQRSRADGMLIGMSCLL
jgi:hypothetical protein